MSTATFEIHCPECKRHYRFTSKVVDGIALPGHAEIGGVKICYNCAAAHEARQMVAHGRHYLAIRLDFNVQAYAFQNPTGTLRFLAIGEDRDSQITPTSDATGSLRGYAGTFVGPEGGLWVARRVTDGVQCLCNRVGIRGHNPHPMVGAYPIFHPYTDYEVLNG